MRKFLFPCFLLLTLSAAAFAEEAAGDWIGQMNGSFKVRIHIDKTESGYVGKLINPSGNETAFDQITSDGLHLHFAVNKLNLSYDASWSDQEKQWKGSLTFQQVYPLSLKRAAAADLVPPLH